MPIYNTSLLTVDTKECRRYAGLMKADFEESVIEDACVEAQLLAAPKGVYEIYDYDAANQTVLCEPPFKLEGRLVAKHLREAEKVILMAVTVGDDIEDHVTKYFEEGRYAYSVILDAAATTAVEQVADGLEKAVAPKIKKMGYKTRWRFSPGYGDWPLTCQPEMVRVSSAESIGVHLSDVIRAVRDCALKSLYIGGSQSELTGAYRSPPPTYRRRKRRRWCTRHRDAPDAI